MITIICCNKSCPKGKFDWNVSIDCMPAKLEDPKAVWKKAFCPHCNQLNWIFVKCKRKRHITIRGRSIRRRGDITIRGRSIRHASTVGRRRGRLTLVLRQSEDPRDPEDPEDHGPHEVPVALTIKGYENRIHLKHER